MCHLNPGAKMTYSDNVPLLQGSDIIVAGRRLFRHYCRKRRTTDKCILIITVCYRLAVMAVILQERKHDRCFLFRISALAHWGLYLVNTGGSMKGLTVERIRICWLWAIFLLIPAVLHGQVQQQVRQGRPDLPPIAAPLVREGDLAVGLLSALGMGEASDESYAESKLGDAGISPRNGWIAGYPVTPDIVGELRKSVSEAADAGRLAIGRDEALRRLEVVASGTGISAANHGAGGAYEPFDYAGYVDDAALNNYYAAEGPPIYTYYAPPVPYYDLYGYVPYPFWFSGFWFPGFYVLHDFHRSFYVGGRVVSCSNHFNDFRSGRFSRIDPVGRFHGTPFAGASSSPRAGFGSHSAVSGFNRTMSNSPQFRAAPGTAAPMRGGGTGGLSYRGAGVANPAYRSAGPTTMAYGRNGSAYAASYATRPASYRTFTSASPSYHAGGYSGSSYHSSGFSGRSMGGVGSSGRSSMGGRSGGFSGRSSGGGNSSGGGHGHR
jgi:hypothetical protein